LIRAFRVVKKRYAADPLGGRGGLESGGRWHYKGVQVVYCAQTLSLAALEFFVHFGKRERSVSLVWFEIAIPQDLVSSLPESRLPAGWRSEPPAGETAELGTEWLKACSSAVLSVPSAVVPGERNFLINPVHPKARTIVASQPRDFSFDPRMWK
jgi:RES domain-containing protein